ncbi:hypothetical protein RI844_15790 [Thalassotalea fonticola]|uniref:Orn/DAP/Arg decarboxylase 2 N-terminal domain-containing protein n=1 Tax=Thalassotalea fonticola TaxID=3065649 RepID=A0ABZ0GLR0_9GAMM|nr:hypothetical protein RI844_15790 [Colwelliaceae bacterium S1-1]
MNFKDIIAEHPYLSVKHGHLHLEGVDLVEAAKTHGTPLFVVSETYLRKNIQHYKQQFEKYWPEGNVKVLPSVKANPNIAIRKIVDSEGAGCDIFGASELECAIRAGVKGENISVNGSIKDNNIINKSISIGATIILDSPKELDLCIEESRKLNKKANILLRLKPYIKDLDDNSDFLPSAQIKQLTQTIKYGIPTTEVMVMVETLKGCNDVNLLGVHIHMGRHSKKLQVWQQLIAAYTNLIKQLSIKLDGWNPKVVNFGGGFAASLDRETRVAVTDYPTPTVEDYAKSITSAFRDNMNAHGLTTKDILIEVEPGRATHNQTGLHLTSVKNIKHEAINIEHTWAEVDTSEVFLSIMGVNPTPPFDFVVASKPDSIVEDCLDIVGSTCNAEWIFEQVMVPKLIEGDVIALLNTGAYVEPMAANFNALPRPGMLLVSDDKSFMIKRHETVDDVFQRDIIPPYI